ncbi:MAG: DHH family phosphoesterase [Eubacteriales bacterium]|nr:DHH family phosphoesterase [Eubacteriales bacterium]
MKKIYNGHSFLGGLMLCIAVFLGVGFYDFYLNNVKMSAIELGLGLLLLVYVVIVRIMRKRDMDAYMSMIVNGDDGLSHNAVTSLPMPMVILSVDGYIMWYNDLFVDIVKEEKLYNVPVYELISDIKWTEILKSETIETECVYNEHIYAVRGKIVKNSDNTSVLLYFDDKTEFVALETKYQNERTVVGLVVIDNYDDIFSKLDDVESQQAVALINRNIVQWVEETEGIIKRLERDRYLVMFENRNLPECIAKKFDVLEKIRQIGEEIHLPVSVSIGVGIGEILTESEEFARAALDMAHGRGGDQAVIKDGVQFSFYGGKTREYEKSTRVKTRTFANAFKDIIKKSDAVFFMGHSNADYDCFGAAIGLSRVCRDMGKRAYIVNDTSQSIELMLAEMREIPEYNGMLISGEYASEIITEESLVVVLDTHRPSMLPAENLLSMTDKVVLIDHHRRSTEFLPHTSLMYHEPYASSTCEMATEIIQYIDDKRTISPFEAKALYVGILMDTKNFMVKTGVRTFEAASFLRRYGLDTVEIKKFFTMDKNDYLHKLKIMETLEVYDDSIGIAFTEEKYANMRVVSSVTCDDMLNIKGIKAAFVVYPIDSDVYISARSFGDINVQLICEKLSGGGHMTVAGAQMKGMSIEAVRLELKAAIAEYINETKEE